MPDDQVIEDEEITEQETDTEAEAGFDEFAGGESDKPAETEDNTEKPPAKDEKAEKKEPAKPEEQPGKTDAKETGDDKKPDEKQEDKQEETEELSAEDAVKKRIAEMEKPAGEEDPAKPDDEKPGGAEDKETDGKKGAQPGEQPETPAKPGRLTKEQLQFHLNVIPDDELPDGEVIIGDQTINFAELKEDDPETYNAMKVMASMAGAKYLNAAIQSGQLISNDVLKGIVDEFDNTLETLEYRIAMAEAGHGDALKIVKTETFQKWRDNLPDTMKAGIQALSDSPNIEDGALVIALYKESMAKLKAGEHDKAAATKKKRKNDLLASELGGKPSAPAGTKGGKGEDVEAFEQATK